jgi:hypothetical protein
MGSDEPPGEGTFNRFRGTVRGQIIQARDVFIVSRPHRRTTLAVLILAALVATAVIVYGPRSPGSTATATSPSTTAGTPLIGDPHSADLCSLARAAKQPMEKFGKVELDPNYGNFNGCDLIIQLPDQSTEVYVEFQLQKAGPPPAALWNTSTGPVSVAWQGLSNGECHRILSVHEPNIIDVGARLVKGQQADLCGMATVATNIVIFLFNGALPLPRRKLVPNSLDTLDACALLDEATLTSEGVGGGAPVPGIGNWSCRWGPAGGRSVDLRFDQSRPLAAPRDGTPVRLGQHNAFVRAGGDGDGNNCLVQVGYRIFTWSHGDRWELVRVVLSGPVSQVSVASLCEPAKRIAEAVERNLPR